MMRSSPARQLALLIGAWIATIAAVTAAVAALVTPAVHDWANTVGFSAGLLWACAGIVVILRRSEASRTP
jgi:hypothetical protein